MKIVVPAILFTAVYLSVALGQSLMVHTKNSTESFKLSDIDSITFIVDDEPAILSGLKINPGDVSGWIEDQNGFREFSNLSMLTEIMNGGADGYYIRGAVEGFIQYMSKTGSDYRFESRVFDFGTAANAVGMYDYITDGTTDKQAVGSYGLDVALVDPDASLTGCKAFAHFGRYFIELSFSGYGSNKNEATVNAAGFVELLKSKVDAL